jgi:hypothetical protein
LSINYINLGALPKLRKKIWKFFSSIEASRQPGGGLSGELPSRFVVAGRFGGDVVGRDGRGNVTGVGGGI